MFSWVDCWTCIIIVQLFRVVHCNRVAILQFCLKVDKNTFHFQMSEKYNHANLTNVYVPLLTHFFGGTYRHFEFSCSYMFCETSIFQRFFDEMILIEFFHDVVVYKFYKCLHHPEIVLLLFSKSLVCIEEYLGLFQTSSINICTKIIKD